MEPHGFALDRPREPPALGRHALPLRPRVDQDLGGNRQVEEVPGERPLVERDGRLLEDRHEVEVTADASVAAGVGAEVPQAQQARVPGEQLPPPTGGRPRPPPRRQAIAERTNPMISSACRIASSLWRGP